MNTNDDAVGLVKSKFMTDVHNSQLEYDCL